MSQEKNSELTDLRKQITILQSLHVDTPRDFCEMIYIGIECQFEESNVNEKSPKPKLNC